MIMSPQVAAAPLVDTKGLGHPLWPNFGSPVTNEGKLEIGFDLRKMRVEGIDASRMLDKDINADQLLD